MHSVPHADRVDLDGRWRFQLLPAPDAEPSSTLGRDRGPRLLDDAGLGRPARTTRTSVMPFAGLPPRVPDANPTGLYEREFEVPAAWADRRIVLHVGAAESVLIARVNGREVGISKDSHLAAEFDVTDVVAVGRNTISPDRRQVVRRQLRRGPGPVVARRHHPLGLPVRDRARAPRRRPGDRRPRRRPGQRLARGPRGGHLRGRSTRAGLDGGGAARRTSPGPSRPRCPTPAASRGPVPAATAASSPIGRSRACRSPRRSARDLWPRLYADLAPANVGQVALRADVAAVRPWSAEVPVLYPLTVALRSPAGAVVEEVVRAASGSGGWRSSGWTCSSTAGASSSGASTATTSTGTPGG